MPVTKTWAGGTFNLPLNREPKGSWGTEVSNFLISLANNALALTGGTQTLSAELNFGATYGLVSAYVKSASANIASSGMLRLAKGDSVAWRNNANGADLALGVNASDRLTFGGVAIPTISSTDALTAKTIVVASNTVTTAASGNLAATELNAALTELQSDIDTRATSATVTAHTGASSGVHGVTGSVVGTTDAQTLTNKTISGASNTLTVRLANDVTGTLGISNGGTGQTAKTAAYNALSPMTTKGDIESFDGTNGVRVAVGSDGTVLSADSTQTAGLKWVSPLTNPMTTTGDIIVGGAAGAATRLAIGASGTVLKGGSTPSYATIVNADVSGSAAIDGSKLQAASASNVGTVSFESSGSFSCTCGGPYVNSAITVSYSRVGKNVSLRFQARRAAGSSSANPISLDFTSMPASLRPAADQVFASVLVTDAGTDQGSPGVVTIPASGNGTLTKSGATTNFTSTASTVGFYAFSVSYTVQ
jgi:hypothetical protein